MTDDSIEVWLTFFGELVCVNWNGCSSAHQELYSRILSEIGHAEFLGFL